MRKAAGILMIIYGVKTMSFLIVAIINNWSLAGYKTEHPFGLIIGFWAVFIIIVGVLCIKSVVWGLCFASSLALFIYVIYDLAYIGLGPHIFASFELLIRLNPIRLVDTILAVPLGVLPEIFICLRKSEWHELWENGFSLENTKFVSRTGEN
jgi:hypothetical protein